MLKDRAGRSSTEADAEALPRTHTAELHAGYVAQALDSYN